MALTKQCVVCGTEFEKPPSCSMREWTERRKCCSLACGNALKRGRPNPRLGDANRGRKLSPEHRAKLAEAMVRRHAEGRAHVIDTAGHAREQSSQWKGEQVGYRAVHVRLYQQRGKPIQCECCETESGPFEWALKQDPEECKVEERGRFKGRSFSTRLDDYIAACRPCHREYDGRERDPHTGRYL